ncbi:MAG: hypothetical protein ACRDXX_18480 [Stackebrandtia sp.]
MKKVLTWSGVAFLVFFIAFRPGTAGDVARGTGGLIADIATGFASFIGGLVG